MPREINNEDLEKLIKKGLKFQTIEEKYLKEKIRQELKDGYMTDSQSMVALLQVRLGVNLREALRVMVINEEVEMNRNGNIRLKKIKEKRNAKKVKL